MWRYNFDVTRNGIFYVGIKESGDPAAIRFYDFALRRSFDLAPPPRIPLAAMRVSPDGLRLLYETNLEASGGLTLVHLRQRDN